MNLFDKHSILRKSEFVQRIYHHSDTQSKGVISGEKRKNQYDPLHQDLFLLTGMGMPICLVLNLLFNKTMRLGSPWFVLI